MPNKTEPASSLPVTGFTAQTLTRKALSGAGWSASSTGIRQALSFASVAILAPLLGPEAYGLLGMATLLTNFLSQFRDLGTTSAVIQRPFVSDRLLSSLFWVNCGLGAGLCLISLAASVAVAAFFHEPKLAPIVQALAASFCLSSCGTMHYALLSREMAFDKIAIVDLCSAVAGYCVSIPAALAGHGVWSLVFGNLTSAATSTALYWTMCRWRPSWQFDRAEVRSVTRFSLNLSGFGILNYFSRNADNLIVGKYLGSVQLGYYQMAYNLMLYPIQNISSVLSQVLFPAFSKIQDDNERFRSAYIRASMLTALLTFPVMAGMGMVADPLIRVVLGGKWLPVILLLQIFAPVGLLQSIQTNTGQIYVAKGRTDRMFYWGLYSSAVFVISFLIGVRWGAVGVAASYFIAYFAFITYPCFAIAFSLIGLNVGTYLRHLWPQFAVTAVMALVCGLWLRTLDSFSVPNAWARLSTTVSLGCGVYVVLLLRRRPIVILHLEEVLGQCPPRLRDRILPILRVFSRHWR